APGENLVVGAVPRDDLWAMETPQIFKREILIDSYTQSLSQSEIPTDEVSVVKSAGGEVFLIENCAPNIKITISGDLTLAEALLTAKPPSL
ncbi:MAG: 2-C-methyl-D-erythritol 4-phosphate cytidylyltransferase, partial [Verrucomicrobiales bacterium]|nr:2-C-methyl-D-erythritol 4-phosphate cytidylyltransferase [Verrucomicrobiales bacterium]